MSIIKIPGFEANLSRKPVKNINLRIDQKGNVNVSAPLKCSIDYIQQFLQKKRVWVLKHQAQIYQQLLSNTPSLHQGEQHFYLGKPYSLTIQENADKSQMVLEGKHLSCYVKSKATYDIKQALLTDWQRQQMQSLLPALIQKWEQIISVHANEWVIRAMKSRWGTCHTVKKRICLNLHLIRQPLICLEYVLVHELVHLLESSHNQRFYSLMSQFMPYWKEYRKLLNHQ